MEQTGRSFLRAHGSGLSLGRMLQNHSELKAAKPTRVEAISSAVVLRVSWSWVAQLARPREYIMETERPKRLVQKFGWRFYVFAPVMAFLAPLLADSLHLFFVVHDGIRFYNAGLGRIA